jgi:hypothetical protein
LAVLGFRVEAAYGTYAVTDAATTVKVYFDSFVPDLSRTPIDFREINATNPVDHSEFVEGLIEVGMTLTNTLRYSGEHGVLQGLAMGDLTTAGSDPYTHTATLETTLPSASWYAEVPNDPNGSTTADILGLKGMKCATATWSHRAGEPLKLTTTWIGQTYDFTVSDLSGIASGSAPSEDIVQWHDKEADSGSDTGLEIEVESNTPVELNCSEWEIRLDNALVRRSLIQTGRLSGEPVRDGKRLVTGRMVIDRDDGYREFVTALGSDPTTDTVDFDVRLRYEDQSNANLKWEALVANCRTTSVPPTVDDDGLIQATVDFRAHASDAGHNQNLPFEVVITNETQSSGGIHYGNFIT